ncbi:16S rRNA (cytosine(1402)-N(4))-methyltransferase RsmH [Candidatus Dependentiae bacterium]|nr:16S rRNA (cytosine(1402)-N(4))-methyltransferase RsmH [Candidatus Dependentiae bacterium]
MKKRGSPGASSKASFVVGEGNGHFAHQPVLVNEVIDGLIVDKNGIYVDATFGRGGHSQEILKSLGEKGVLVCVDKDQEAIEIAHQLKDPRVIVRQGSFTKLLAWFGGLDYLGKVSGILVDLGVSSPQLDDPQRGFSFMRDGPLDMRMDQSQLLTAASWLQAAQEEEISRVLKEYGEEKFSRRIAKNIVAERKIQPITTTGRLAEIVSVAHPRWEEHKHPATRTFQAIRILINNELTELKEFLDQSLKMLKVGGRLAVISFHSLEDRIVKNFIKEQQSGGIPKWVPVCDRELSRCLGAVGRAIRATEQEVASNPRSRSAVLRIMEKLK